jgi:hypothetical protein
MQRKYACGVRDDPDAPAATVASRLIRAGFCVTEIALSNEIRLLLRDGST